MPRSRHGGRHELGQNFLSHTPTIARIVDLVSATSGPILEIGAGDGALTRRLAELNRPLTAIDIDEHRTRRLTNRFPTVQVECADAMRYPLDSRVVVGNIPFHLTTPLLRRLLSSGEWRHAVLLTQWEVARKRAGVGGSTMMTAQAAPWFEFSLEGRVPATAFRPMPSVDGGILSIIRRGPPLVPGRERVAYEQFVHRSFTGRGRSLAQILCKATGHQMPVIRRAIVRAGVPHRSLPRDLTVDQWASLWTSLGRTVSR
ncbi:23S ribosomal RNA methyltransferase Erm [Kocuria soli]|uniref:23S ribosomal RNA methyltransferase Erm n=1 Tax=Kocuria soli TaxID=2485125 RepID=A0A3N3ZTP7_9MICC|nr:23S ribosomal RNA methyltransferase Erm [Kocuria soli]ROZ64272.1 23S ribosomal RNA methyltransferase Erm [Kocuria soli]